VLRSLSLFKPVLALAELTLLVFVVTPCAAVAPLLLVNGNVYTADDSNPRGEAVLAVNGRVVFIGASAEALRRAPHGTRRVDLHGLTVLPGLTDAHAHLAGIGFRELSFNLEGATSLADLKSQLRELPHCAETSGGRPPEVCQCACPERCLYFGAALLPYGSHSPECA